MSQPAPPGVEPPQQPQHIGLSRFSRPVVGTLLVLLAVMGVGSWRLLVFMNEELAPLISKALSESLNRPVEVGELQQYSFTGMRFGPSALPAYETRLDGKTIIDDDVATTESVDVSFNIWKTLQTRTLNLDVTLVEPQLSIDEDAQGRWILTRLKEEDEEDEQPFVKIQLDTLRVQNGQAVIKPFQAPARTLKDWEGAIAISEARIGIKGEGTLDSGGTARVDGEWKPEGESLQVNLNTKDLAVVPLLGFIPGDLPFQIRSGEVSGNLDLVYQPQQPLKLIGQAEISGADIQVPEQNIRVKAQRVKSNFRVAYTEKQIPKIGGEAEFQGADLALPEQLIFQNGRSRLQSLQNTTGKLQFIEADQGRVQFDAQGTLASGGRLRTKGEASLDLAKINLLLLARNISAPILDQAFELPIAIAAGRVDANLNIQLRPDGRPNVRGVARMQKIDAQIKGLPKPFANANGFIRFRGGLTTSLEGVTARYGQVPLTASGIIDIDKGYNITAQTPLMELNTALNTLGIAPETLPFPLAGQVQVPALRVTGAIDQPSISGQVATAAGTQIDRVPFKTVSAQFRLTPPLLQISQINARPEAGGIITGQARYALTPGAEVVANLDAKDVPGDTIARLYDASPAGITVGPVFAQVKLSGQPDDIRTTVAFQARRATYATTGTIRLQSGVVVLDNIVAQLAKGTARINGQLKDEKLQANVRLANIALNTFSQDLRGALDGSVDLSGPLASLSAETIRADGNLRFSEGLSLIEAPLNSRFGWNGRQILVKDASAPGFRANGIIAAQLAGAPQITGLDLNVLASNYDLRSLAALGPSPVPLTGRADLIGRLTGTLTAPRLRSALTLKNLAVSQFAFEPRLSGRLSYGQGLDLNLQGNRDRIQVALAPDLQPQSFLIQRDQAIAKGTAQGDTLFVDVQKFPLTAFNGQVASLGLGPASGMASGTFQANLKAQSLVGTIAVQEPGLGRLKGDQFTGGIRYGGGVATLDRGKLLSKESQYLVNAQLKPGETPSYAGQLKIVQGQIADVIAAAQSIGRGVLPTDGSPAYGTAADVQTYGVGSSEAPLFEQLQRLAEVNQLIAQQQATVDPTQFDIADLEGQFGGQLSFAGSGLDIDGSFDLRGSNFKLNTYQIEEVIVAGGIQDGTLQFKPLQLATGDRQATFIGQMGLEEQSGELVMNNVALAPLNDWLTLPEPVSGDLNGKVILSGSLFDPQAQGQFSLANAKLGDQPIRQAETQFSYGEANLRFDSTAYLDNPEPIQVSGTIPYALPFAFAVPDSDEITINAKVKDQGLALMSLATDQVAWVDGNGQVDLQIRGTLAQPTINGTVALNNATLKAQILEDPLQNVTGTLQFDRNIVTVPSMKGTYNSGEVLASGSLPIFAATATPQPLTVNLNNLDVSVEDLYRGGVTGQVLITGAAVEPVIGGNVQLRQGQVFLTKATSGSSESSPEDDAALTEGSEQQTDTASSARRYVPISELAGADRPLRLNNLELQLGENVRISQAPILSLVASGNLVVDGPATAPLARGKIQFRQGSINLITSRFRVDPRQNSFAEFDPAFGLDPYLNLAMRTTVTEVTQARSTALNEAEEVPASSLGSFQSVRVRAVVDGRASQLVSNFKDVVEVTSSPQRSEGEILALLGGGVSDSIQQGQAQQAAVNLASSAAFTEVQGLFDGLLGSRATFRAFPVLLPNASENEGSVLSLGAELGYAVTDKFSISVLQVLTGVNEPTLFNLSYDINRNLTTRTSISADGEAVGILEYRIRF
jgi:translocation and assembly module TamB